MVDDGVCSIPCKQLFGLTCGSCTQGLGKAYPECLTNDPRERPCNPQLLLWVSVLRRCCVHTGPQALWALAWGITCLSTPQVLIALLAEFANGRR